VKLTSLRASSHSGARPAASRRSRGGRARAAPRRPAGAGPRTPPPTGATWVPDRRLAAIPAALAVAAAVFAGTPRLLLALGGPTAAHPGTLTPSWTAPAAFVHPGSPVDLPSAGQLLGLLGPGLVPAGARLALFAPVPPVRIPTAFVGAVRRAPQGTPREAARPFAAALVCLRRACAAPVPAATPAAPRDAGVPAGGTGWFSPGWDPLAALPPAAYSDLPPRAVLLPVGAAPRPGAPLSGGAPLGSLGDPWTGYWLCVLPASATVALGHAASASIDWPGARAPMPVSPAGTGPAVSGRVVGIFAAGALGPDPGPPPRATAEVRLPPVSGQIIPAGALVRAGTTAGAAVVAVSAGGRLRLLHVRPLAVVGGRAVVAGLPAGTRVLAHPGRVPVAAAGGA